MPRFATRALAVAALLAVLPVSADPGPQLTALPSVVQKALSRARLPDGGLSVWVQEVGSEHPLLAVAPDEPRNPASVMKLVTTAAALHELGPAYAWRTYAYATGPVVDGRLEGDLVLVGQGDPYLVTERFWRFLRGIRATGVREVAGDLVIDDTFLAPAPQHPGDFDGKPRRVYNAQPGALVVNYNAIEFRFRPDRRANEVVITTDPPTAELRIENRLKLTGGRCGGRKYRIRMHVTNGPDRDAVRFTGQYPASCGRHALLRSVSTDHARFAWGVFRALWRELGGTVEGGLRRAAVPEDARLLHRFTSPPLGEQIRSMNKFSNNMMTRNLLLTLGAERLGPPGTEEKGRTAVADWLERRGIEAPELFVENGSGLSRDARVTARTLGRLLVEAWRSPFMPEFAASLPLAALDGTMRKRFRDSDMEGRMHLKTGLINHVRTVAGYVHARSGRTWAVAMLHNRRNIHWGAGTDVQDAMLEWVFER